jgi:hemolysin D
MSDHAPPTTGKAVGSKALGRTQPVAVPPVKRTRADQQFLPGLLEILETPQAPLATVMIVVICAFFSTAAIWAYFGQIDIIAVAQGKVQPTGRVKTIQSLVTGRVAANHAENGRHVAAGDVLIELDPSETQAERDGVSADLKAFQAEVLRRTVAMKLARSYAFEPAPAIAWPNDVPTLIRTREERVLEADLAQLGSQVSSLAAQRAQKSAERARLIDTIAVQKELVATLEERVTMRTTLLQQSAGTKASVIDATETYEYHKATLAQEMGQIAETDANMTLIDREIEKAFRTFIADNAQKLDEAERQVASLTERLARADSHLTEMNVKSPLDGTVQSSIVTTDGQVVTPGAELMRLVPDDATLEIESYLPNKDVGFVKVGQSAVIKLVAFPFTRYGTIEATVVHVAHDAIPEPDASQIEQDPARERQSGLRAGADRVQNLVFAVTLKPQKTTMVVDGVRVPIRPGMEVTTEIRTGSRRILDYVFSPLMQVGSEALRER